MNILNPITLDTQNTTLHPANNKPTHSFIPFLQYNYHFDRSKRMNTSHIKYFRILLNKKSKTAFYLHHKKILLIHPQKFLKLIYSISLKNRNSYNSKNCIRSIPFLNFCDSLLQSPLNHQPYTDYILNKISQLKKSLSFNPTPPSNFTYHSFLNTLFSNAFPNQSFISPATTAKLLTHLKIYNANHPDQPPKTLHAILNNIITNAYKPRNPSNMFIAYALSPDKPLYPYHKRRKFLYAIQHTNFYPTLAQKKLQQEYHQIDKITLKQLKIQYAQLVKQVAQENKTLPSPPPELQNYSGSIKWISKRSKKYGTIHIPLHPTLKKKLPLPLQLTEIYIDKKAQSEKIRQEQKKIRQQNLAYQKQIRALYQKYETPYKSSTPQIIQQIQTDPQQIELSLSSPLLSQLQQTIQHAQKGNQDINLAAIAFIKKMLKSPISTQK